MRTWLKKLDFSLFWREPTAPDALGLRLKAGRKRVQRQISAATRMLEAADVIALEMPTEDAPIEQQIIAELDRTALSMMRVLQNDERDENGALLVDFKMRHETFKMLTQYLEKRRKAAPEGDADGMPPYERIRKWLDENGLEIRPKRAGRPTLEQQSILEKLRSEEEAARAKPKASPLPPAEPPPGDDDMAVRLRALAEKRAAEAVNGQA